MAPGTQRAAAGEGADGRGPVWRIRARVTIAPTPRIPAHRSGRSALCLGEGASGRACPSMLGLHKERHAPGFRSTRRAKVC